MLRIDRCLGLYMAFFLAWGPSPVQATPHPSCKELTEKVCKTIGPETWSCQLHKDFSSDSKVQEERCKNALGDFEAWTKNLRRIEENLAKMDKLGQQYGAEAQGRIEAYKKTLATKMHAEMTGQGQFTEVDPKACELLVHRVCQEIGAKSYYCTLFTILTKDGQAKAEKCQTLLNDWPNQKTLHQAQEARMQQMMLIARQKPEERTTVLQAQRNEMMRLSRFLRE